MDHSHHLVEFSYGLAFMTGILGSGHCLGMCGSLVSGFFMRHGATSSAPYLIYHAARVSVYGLIGLTAASLGAVLVQIALIDLVFSLDSVITAVGMTTNIPAMIIAVISSVMVMRVWQ